MDCAEFWKGLRPNPRTHKRRIRNSTSSPDLQPNLNQMIPKQTRVGMIRFAVALLMVSLSTFSAAQTLANTGDFDAFVDATFDRFMNDSPTRGTSLGFHQYDLKLEDYSQKAIADQTKWCHTTLALLAKFDRAKLTPDQQIDARMIESWLRDQLLESEDIRMWQRNPDIYSSGI